MPPLPKPKPKGKPTGGPKNKAPETQPNGAPNSAPNNSNNTAPAAGKNKAPKTTGKQVYKTVRNSRKKAGKIVYSHAGAVKMEFLIGIVLLLLAPIGNPNLKMNSDYAKRLMAYCLLFMVLFPLGQAQNPKISKAAAALGGLFILSMMVLPRSKGGGFAVDFISTINSIVQKLQPKAKPI